MTLSKVIYNFECRFSVDIQMLILTCQLCLLVINYKPHYEIYVQFPLFKNFLSVEKWAI